MKGMTVQPNEITDSKREVAVLGLGAMGTALATGFLRAGHPTTVWNRTRQRGEGLVKLGAAPADSVDEAVVAAGLVVVSLLDASAVFEVLNQVPQLEGRTVINLTSTTPEQAERISTAVIERGGSAVIGAVMVTPPMVATDDAVVLYSGDRSAFDEHRATLAALGGEATWVGDEPGAASLLDLAMLDLFYGSVTAFIHAVALARVKGMSAGEFLPFAQRMFDLAALTATELAEDVDSLRYPGDENNLAMMLRSAEHLVEVSIAEELDPAVPETTRRLMQAAVDAGHAGEGYGRIIKHLHAPPPQIDG
jgi:3-hydroxyisobutyrate dehydrogenase-like beta-hydroxyacid dehydrogenase